MQININRLKKCPRCRGNLFMERGYDGLQIVCLQCGYRIDVKERKPYHIHNEVRQILADYQTVTNESSKTAEQNEITLPAPENNGNMTRSENEDPIGSAENDEIPQRNASLLSHFKSLFKWSRE